MHLFIIYIYKYLKELFHIFVRRKNPNRMKTNAVI